MNDRALVTSGVPGSRTAVIPRTVAQAASFSIILSLSFCHLLNDLMQSLVPALYPILKSSYGLSFGQIGVITLTQQCIASMLQPMVGLYTDRRPQPYSLAVGMGATLIGLVKLAEPHIGPSRVDEYAALASMLFLASAIASYISIRHPDRAWLSERCEIVADQCFLAGLIGIAGITLFFAYEVI